MPDEKLARAIRARARRNLLKILCHKKKASVHELASELGLTESSTSKHLKMLYDFNLLDFESKPPEKFYFLKMNELRDLLSVYDKISEKLRKR